MTTIYLVRHAEAEGNLYRIAQGQNNSNLTTRGWRQVQALERRFADIPIDAVYASDLFRTCATASSVYKPKGLELHRMRELREICVGDWEECTWGDIYRRDAEQMDNFSNHPERWRVNGAEEPAQVLERVLTAIRNIAKENDGKTVAVFSHGYALRLLLARLQGFSIAEMAQTPVGDNTAVSLIEVEGAEMRVVFRDDNSHLHRPEYLAGEMVRKRATGLEPGLYFEPFEMEAHRELFVDLVSSVWTESGDKRPFDRERLLADTAERPTLIGYRAGEMVGVVQFGPEKGWISLACVRAEWRKRGFGIQMIGQAVLHDRPRGCESLRIALPVESPFRQFCEEHGFVWQEETTEGRMILEKNIGFDPEITWG